MNLERAAVIGPGQLGEALIDELASRGIGVTVIGRSELDLAKTESIASRLKPLLDGEDAVFMTAALTDVDACEHRRDEALRVNGIAPGAVAATLEQKNTRIVHFSSDYVFGENHAEPIPPGAEPAPLSVYGLSKRAGELAVSVHHSEPLIVRSSGLFGSGDNFVTAIAERLLAGDPVEVVDDQVTLLCSAEYLAAASVELLERGVTGLQHIALRGAGSWYEHAVTIAEALGIDREMVEPIESGELDRAAQRPTYSVLDISATAEKLGSPPAFPGVLEDYLESLEITREQCGKV